MNAKEYLLEFGRINAKIESLSDAVRRIKDLEDRITVDPTKERVQSTGTTDRVGKLAAEIADKEDEIAEQISNGWTVLSDINSTLQAMDYIQGEQVLRLRYIQLLKPGEICERLNISRATEGRYHQRGLMVVQKILDKRQIDTK